MSGSAATGKAAVLIAARGVDVLGIEPDARMAAVARRHGLRIEVCEFEHWPPAPHDLVVSAQAWHWVDPRRGAAKAVASLPVGGRWAAFWNREIDPMLTAVVESAYARMAPHLLQDGWTPEGDEALVGSIASPSVRSSNACRPTAAIVCSNPRFPSGSARRSCTSSGRSRRSST